MIGGGVYFNEFASFSVKQYACFATGVVIIFFGVGVLAKRLGSIQKDQVRTT